MIIKVGSLVNIINKGACYSYTTIPEFYKEHARYCFPYLQGDTSMERDLMAQVDTNESCEVIASAPHPTSNIQIYLVNIKSIRYCIIIEGQGIKEVIPSPVWEITIKPDTDKWDNTIATIRYGNGYDAFNKCINIPREPKNQYDINAVVYSAMDALLGKQSEPEIEAERKIIQAILARPGDMIEVTNPISPKGYEMGDLLIAEEPINIYYPSSIYAHHLYSMKKERCRLYNKEYTILQHAPVNHNIKKVSRLAKIGEYIEIVKTETPREYHNGQVLLVIREWNDFGVLAKTENHPDGFIVRNTEYVVLEGYKPQSILNRGF